MPLVQEDLRQIKGLVETLIAKKIAPSASSNEEKAASLLSDKDLIEKILQQMDKRFEQMDRRFEQVDKRFEDMNRRFEDMNKRFEDMNRRFEEMRKDMNKRFQQLFWFIGLFMPLYNSLLLVAINYLVK